MREKTHKSKNGKQTALESPPPWHTPWGVLIVGPTEGFIFTNEGARLLSPSALDVCRRSLNAYRINGCDDICRRGKSERLTPAKKMRRLLEFASKR
jgi:hypothetical protein